MINYITGIVKEREKQLITLEVGAFGVAVQVPNAALFGSGDGGAVTVYTYLHWSQENGPTIFGFLTPLERTVFILVIGCSGIGPKIALALLEGMAVHQFLDAIQTGNDAALSKVNGIGAKKAEQIIVALKHKVAQLIKSGAFVEQSSTTTHWSTLSDALGSLSYSPAEIARTMKYLNETQVEENIPFDKLLRYALAFLSKQR
jgi:Holliday junction DNA helicase RuvA